VKRILVVTPTYFPETRTGGPVTGCRQLVKALNTFCDVCVATLNTVPVASHHACVDNVHVRYFSYSPIFDFLSKSSWGFSLDFSLWFILNISHYDHVYFRSYWNYISLFGILCCLICKKGYSISSSGKFTAEAMTHSAAKKRFLFPFTSLSLRHASFIHYASHDELRQTALSCKKLTRSLVCPTPIDVLPESAPHINRILVYTVSRFSSIKQLDIAVSAISQFFLKNPLRSIDVVHYGDYSSNPHLFKTLVESYSHLPLVEVSNEPIQQFSHTQFPESSFVCFPGHISRSSVDKNVTSYSKHVFLQMSTTEGQSNSVLEAMARRSLVIVSPGCNMKSASREDALLEVTSNNLCNILESLLSSPEFPMVYPTQYLERHHSFEAVKSQFLPLL